MIIIGLRTGRLCGTKRAEGWLNKNEMIMKESHSGGSGLQSGGPVDWTHVCVADVMFQTCI